MCTEIRSIMTSAGDDNEEEFDLEEAIEDANSVFEEFKIIIKELLFNGADRNIKTKQG